MPENESPANRLEGTDYPQHAFKPGETLDFIVGNPSRRLREKKLNKSLWRALRTMESAPNLTELRRLNKKCHEIKHQKRMTQRWAIWATGQYRICFDWDEKFPHPYNMEISKHYGN